MSFGILINIIKKEHRAARCVLIEEGGAPSRAAFNSSVTDGNFMLLGDHRHFLTILSLIIIFNLSVVLQAETGASRTLQSYSGSLVDKKSFVFPGSLNSSSSSFLSFLL